MQNPDSYFEAGRYFGNFSASTYDPNWEMLVEQVCGCGHISHVSCNLFIHPATDQPLLKKKGSPKAKFADKLQPHGPCDKADCEINEKIVAACPSCGSAVDEATASFDGEKPRRCARCSVRASDRRMCPSAKYCTSCDSLKPPGETDSHGRIKCSGTRVEHRKDGSTHVRRCPGRYCELHKVFHSPKYATVVCQHLFPEVEPRTVSRRRANKKAKKASKARGTKARGTKTYCGSKVRNTKARHNGNKAPQAPVVVDLGVTAMDEVMIEVGDIDWDALISSTPMPLPPAVESQGTGVSSPSPLPLPSLAVAAADTNAFGQQPAPAPVIVFDDDRSGVTQEMDFMIETGDVSVLNSVFDTAVAFATGQNGSTWDEDRSVSIGSLDTPTLSTTFPDLSPAAHDFGDLLGAAEAKAAGPVPATGMGNSYYDLAALEPSYYDMDAVSTFTPGLAFPGDATGGALGDFVFTLG